MSNWTAKIYRAHPVADGNENACYYCGQRATATDHVVPIRLANDMTAAELDSLIAANRLVTVPACGECNSLLGAKPLVLLRERKAYIRRRLEQRYRAYFETPDWTDSDLAQLGDELRRQVLDGVKLRDQLRERLRWATGRAPVDDAARHAEPAAPEPDRPPMAAWTLDF